MWVLRTGPLWPYLFQSHWIRSRVGSGALTDVIAEVMNAVKCKQVADVIH